MFAKLAGHLPLADMISQIIDDSRTKIAAAEGEKDEKVKKLVKYEKKEHGHVPSVKEEKEEKEMAEKKASAIDYSDAEEVEKLASALEQVGEEFLKMAADEQDHGKEYKGGGETLAVMSPVSGKQPYKKDSSKAHNVPMSSGLQAGDAKSATTQVPNDHAKAPGGAPYPKKGVMKTASESILDKIRAAAKPAAETEEAEVVTFDKKDGEKVASPAVARLQAALEKKAEFPPKKEEKDEDKKEEKGEKKAPPFMAKKDEKKEDKGEEKKASAVDFIMGKIANAEKSMGGETLDSKSGEGPKPPSNPGREMISSNAAATNATKAKAKAPQKKLMSQVLTEPMQSKAHDSKVSENLRNASKGGVKIAAARELLKKVAAEGCTCEGKGDCRHCKMKKAMEKKSMGGMPMGGASMPSSSPMM